MEKMFKQWIEERKRQGPDSQQMQGDKKQSPGMSQNIQSLLRKQSLALVGNDQSTPCQTNSPQLNQVVQPETTRQTQNEAFRRVESRNSSCSVA